MNDSKYPNRVEIEGEFTAMSLQSAHMVLLIKN